MENNTNLVFVVYIHYRTWIRYTRKPHFAELSKHGSLYIIENPLVILSREFLNNIFKNIKFYFKYSRRFRNDKSSGAVVYRPILLFSPTMNNKLKICAQIDSTLLNIQIGKIYRYNQITINFLTNLSQQWLIKEGKFNYWIVDINDDWSMMSYEESNRSIIEEKVKSIIRKTDLATAVTRKLAEKYNLDNKCIFIPNGVDTDHYKPHFDKSERVKVEENIHNLVDIKFLEKEKNDPRLYITNIKNLRDLKSPLVGSYSGLSGNWSDFAFMMRVEEILPDKFTMVSSGNIHPPTKPEFIKEYKEYLKKQRMIYLGYVDYSVLPDFLNELNVGLVMHRMDEFNTHSAPNKIWAYLAMGLPVVSTDFLTDPDKEIYEGMVLFAKTPEDYCRCIIESFENDNIGLRKERRNLALRYSTEKRAYKLVHLIHEHLLKPGKDLKTSANPQNILQVSTTV